MAKRKSTILTDLSTADLKRLLAARERIDILEKDKARLVKELDAVDKELSRLVGGSLPRGRKKAVGKKKARKKTARKVVKKKTTKKKVAKRTTKKKVVRKAPVRKTRGGKATTRKAATGRVTLEDVIVKVIRRKKGPVTFKDLKATIVNGKLFKTKSANFDNVLRRTLSTSKAVKRVGRGVYDVA